ncbi:uncharacterized protein LOC131428624 [Malaya genurostris]|uniref:uncharacterized protein LOC131428624 n=1 Tax=Malaya genurostris TaxID=325434 RepID=UPI0026F3CC6F|nr:uncharacterized protein LOC131428624 [Malaya genurostris]
MFIAHLIHESSGFQHREAMSRGRGQPYGRYYGRGYIMLTWEDNYRAASRDMFHDDRLVQNPDLVSASTSLSMDVSIWYWMTRVRPEAAPFNNFYLTTKAIKGVLEGNAGNPAARRRFDLYRRVALEFGLYNLAREG